MACRLITLWPQRMPMDSAILRNVDLFKSIVTERLVLRQPVLAPTHQNQGYATEALQAVLEFLFVDLEKHGVFVSVDPRNEAAIALFKRVGMRQEAHFVESLWFDGALVDDIIFALLQREWKSRGPLSV